MSTHPLRFAAFTVALLTIGTALSAQEPGFGFGPGHGRGFGHGPAGEGRGLRALNLTEAQQAKVKAIHDGHQTAFKAKGEVAGAAHKALFEAMQNASTDAATLKALHDKASTAQFELMLEHRAVRQEILPLLTADQKAQFEKLPMGPQGVRGKGPGMGMGRRGMQPS